MSSLPPTRGPVSARVVCRVRAGQTQTFKLRNEESVIGREPAMAIAVPLEGVSRHHARILWDGKNHWLEDMRSTNGTFLNGGRVERERLRHLDVISLGKKIDLVFILRTEEAAVRKVGIVRAALVEEGPDGLTTEIPMGEITLGRSAACNVQADSTAVSKVHARIERTAEQLVLQDLGSSNGTFVNGSAVMTAALKNGDLVSLAGLDAYKVVIETGEVTSGTGTRLPAYEMPPARTVAEEGRPRFSAAWKTRFEWDSNELMELAELHNVVEAEAAAKAAPARAAAAPGAPAAAKPTAPAAARPTAPAAAKPTAPPPVAAKPPSAKPAAAPPASAMPEQSGDTVKPASVARPPAAPPVRPAAAAPPPAKPAAAAPPPRPAAPPSAPPSAPAAAAPLAKPAAAPAAPAPAAARPAPPVAAPAPPAPAAASGPPPSPASRAVSRVVAGPPPVRPPATPAATRPAPAPPPPPVRPAAAPPKPAASVQPPAPPAAPAKPPAAAPPLAAAAPPRPPVVLPASSTPADLGSPAPTVAMETPSFVDAGPRPILEVALRGTGFDLTARGSGAHDIGRSSEAALRIVHATVSRRHARLILSDDRMAVYVQDVGGANGTRLNGRTVTGVEALKEGDVVGLGEVELTVSFVRG